MNDITDYISIPEFARLANVSRQAVYQRIDKDLTKYCKVIDSKKMLSLKALELFVTSKVQPLDTQQTSDCKEVEQAVDSNLQKNLIKTIELLQEQLQVKDRQLEQQLQVKDKQLEAKDRQLENVQQEKNNLYKLLDQQQKLQAGTIQQKQITTIPTAVADEDAQPIQKNHWWNKKK